MYFFPLCMKNFLFFTRYRELKAASDSKITELQSDLKLKQFEFDRLQMLYEETSQCLKQANVDTTKYQHKLEVCTWVFIHFKTKLTTARVLYFRYSWMCELIKLFSILLLVIGIAKCIQDEK